ncbi:MAG: helicase RepA family protein [Campylobacteraceae bacterium]|nr:helicase RepA family protein [Campylobacteraceae bacterium]
MSTIFNFLEEHKLNSKHFMEKVEFYIPNFLPRGLITMIYADGGQGKSYLSLCLAKRLLAMGVERLIYLDFDNPLSVLKTRGVDTLIKMHKNLNYIQRSSLDLQPFDLLLKLEENGVSRAYNNCVFIVDSIRNFVDIGNDAKAMRLMNAFMRIRDAGATIILLHHANKDGRNYQGSNNIRNSLDCMYSLEKHLSLLGEINITLEVIKERAGVKDIGFTLYTSTLEMVELDMRIAKMEDKDRVFVDKALKILNKPMNKTQFLKRLGYEKDDKRAREMIERFEGVFWDNKKQSNICTYYPRTTVTTSPIAGSHEIA